MFKIVIQSFYNVFLAHFNQLSKEYEYPNQDILTGMMQQPQMNPNASFSNQDGKGTNLPFVPKPTFFITNKEPRYSSAEELKILEMKVLGKISGQDKSLSAICIRRYDKECPFCQSINSQFQDQDDSTPKLFHKGNDRNYFGFRGCEQNNLIFHFHDAYDDTIFECFSRARENLMVIIDKTSLEKHKALSFNNTIKEMLRHDRKCENEKCKENGKLRIEGKDYIVKDGDVLYFRVNP